MKLTKLGPNMTELEFSDGLRVLISYETPVAARYSGLSAIKSDQYFSRSTTAHVKKWLGEMPCATVPHVEILRIAREK